MSTVTVAGLLLLVLPVSFNVAFGVLAATFDYPDILRRPTPEVLARFREGGKRLLLSWWIFALTAAALAPLAVLVARSLADASRTLLIVGATVGVLAALVQLLGLIRWPFLIPYLARVDADPDASPARREAVDIVFQSFNRYLGVAVGEHLGYLLTGAWTILVGVAFTQTSVAPGWLGIPGIVIGAVLALCSLEFVGPAEATAGSSPPPSPRSPTSRGHCGSSPAASRSSSDSANLLRNGSDMASRTELTKQPTVRTMRAIVQDTYGTADALRLEQIDRPTAAQTRCSCACTPRDSTEEPGIS